MRKPRLGFLLVAITSLHLASCGDSSESPPQPVGSTQFTLELFDYDGAAGYAIRHHVTPEEYTVSLYDDRRLDDEVLWQTELNEQQRRDIAALLDGTNWNDLEQVYEDPGVWDGFQVYFEITIGGKPKHGIQIANADQPDLRRLSELLDTVVPEEYRIRFRESIDELSEDPIEEVPLSEEDMRLNPFGDTPTPLVIPLGDPLK